MLFSVLFALTQAQALYAGSQCKASHLHNSNDLVVKTVDVPPAEIAKIEEVKASSFSFSTEFQFLPADVLPAVSVLSPASIGHNFIRQKQCAHLSRYLLSVIENQTVI